METRKAASASGRPMRIGRRATGFLVGVVSLLCAAAPVAADCQPAGPIEEALPDAPVAFVGTVTDVQGAVATIAVREVWAGEVADTVVVRGLFDDLGGVGPNVGAGGGLGEDDRHWMRGATYLVVPWVHGGVLRDSICTATTEWDPELEQLRPSGARVLAAGPADGPSIPPAVILAGAVLAIIACVSALAFRHR